MKASVPHLATGIIAGVAAVACAASLARSADLRCDMPGVALMIVPDIFANNPNAKKLGLTVEGVTLLNVEETESGPICLVSVKMNRGYALKYNFHLSPSGEASLDLAP
jgi:hypothetical protein